MSAESPPPPDDMPAAIAKKPRLETQYQWLSQRDWVLQRPATMIGSIVPTEKRYLVFGDDGAAAITPVTMVPAAEKIIKEALDNALDNFARDPSMKYVKVNISRAEGGYITVANDGFAPPVGPMAGAEDLNTCTVLFGRWHSGSNFDTEREDGSMSKDIQTALGQNGVGIKGLNCYSKHFEVQVQNSDAQKVFRQTWTDNMGTEGPVSLQKSKKKGSEVKLTFLLDWARLNLPEVAERGLSHEQAMALESLVYQTALCAPPSVKVYLNDKEIKMRTPSHFVAATKAEKPFATDCLMDAQGQPMFTICVAARPPAADPIFESFVNGARCEGTLVDLVLARIRDIVQTKIRSKKEYVDFTVKTSTIRSEIVCVVSATVDNPLFDSQTKTNCVSKLPKLWTTPSASFRGAIEKSEVFARCLASCKHDADAKLNKTTKPTKSLARIDIPKYESAIYAGKYNERDGKYCTLILTEGDSAKALALAGLAVTGREYWGVFPLKGKPLNCRNVASRSKVLDNAEMAALLKILGLQFGQTYTPDNVNSLLRYQSLLIMADQDTDGDHICSLILSNLVCLFPQLFVARPDYVRRLATPIVRVSLPGGGPKLNFFTEVQYHAWRAARVRDQLSTGTSRYYKGLGTSNAEDAREYFRNIEANTIILKHTGEESDAELHNFFHQSKADARRAFLENDFDDASYVDYANDEVDIRTFLRNGLSHFSHYDNRRSIPHVIDGLKTSQRKILFVLREKNLYDKLTKVAQVQGMVAERSEYHHGEQSLALAIVNMAADYGNANSISLLHPEGCFGTRHQTGDAAGPRYINTKLDKITKYIFRTEDDAVIEHLYEDGRRIEPKYFVPVIPMSLVNSNSGIGTGWKMESLSFDPYAVIEACRAWLDLTRDGSAPPSPPAATSEDAMEVDDDAPTPPPMASYPPVTESMMLWCRHHTGRVERLDADTFVSHGVYHIEGNDVHITELPIGVVTNDYEEDLKKRLVVLHGSDAADRFVDEIKTCNSDTSVLLILKCKRDKLERVKPRLAELLKISRKHTLRYLNFFSHDKPRPELYTPDRIVDEFARVRLATYKDRIAAQIHQAEEALSVAENKRRFIQAIVDEELIIRRFKSNSLLCEHLVAQGYAKHHDSFDYLTKMPQAASTEENLGELAEKVQKIEMQLAELRAATAAGLWRAELEELRSALGEYDARKAATIVPATLQGLSSSSKQPKGKAKKRAA